MSRPVLPLKIERAKSGAPVTAHAGLALILQMLARIGIFKDGAIDNGTDKQQGWLDGQMLLTIVLMNILGLNRVSDAERLEEDSGLRKMVRRCEQALFGRRQKSIEARFRGGRKRVFPSSRSIRDWLDRFHDEEAGKERVKGKAIIPIPADPLKAVQLANQTLLEIMVKTGGYRDLTLDIDATIIPSQKKQALPTYRSATGAVPGERGYQPLNVYCPELDMVLYSEMRDGNVPAKMDNLRVLVEALKMLPDQINTVRVRSDSAGHCNDLIAYCNDPQKRPEADNTRRLGIIRFIISAEMSEDLADAMRAMPDSDWQLLVEEEEENSAPAEDGSERSRRFLGEVPFVSNANAAQRKDAVIRYVGTLRTMPGNQLGVGHNERPPSETLPACRMFAYVTNYAAFDDPTAPAGAARLSGETVVRQANDRCGRSEQIHDMLKNGLSGDILPAGRFGANAAWWLICIVANNVLAWLRSHFNAEWRWCRIKRFRTVWLTVAGRVCFTGGRLIVKLDRGRGAALCEAFHRLAAPPSTLRS